VEAPAAPRASRLGLTLLVIRHARAGKRSEWEGDDRRRPLDERGTRQARDLVDAVASFEISRILSSPYDRCVQTVAPLAAARGLVIEQRDELGEEQQGVAGVALARSLLAEPVALCVHAGLSDVAFGESLKKGETLVVEDDGRVAARIRP
jgi:broad specificity phosphatase PhoE